MISSTLQCPCRSERFARVFVYDTPPPGEVRFEFSNSDHYRRELMRCQVCGHFLSVHSMDEGKLYEGDYLNTNYGDEDGLRQAFERIINLDPSRSDNAGRVSRILSFAAAHFSALHRQAQHMPTVLDVGSGLCVFLYGMKRSGWNCTAFDVDPRYVKHARDVVGVKAVCGNFMSAGGLGRYDLITYNKVLEHVPDPVAMLARSLEMLNEDGAVYVEVPDGEAAVEEGPEREEFFIDHLHVFSVASLALLASRAGFRLVELERLREPSSKFTLRAFLVAQVSMDPTVRPLTALVGSPL